MRTWLVLGIAASCLSAQEIQLWLTKLLMTGEERGDLKRDKSVDFSSSASWCWSRFSQSRQRTSLCYSSEPEHMSGISSIPQSASASALTIDIIFSPDQVSLEIGNVQQASSSHLCYSLHARFLCAATLNIAWDRSTRGTFLFATVIDREEREWI